MQMTARTISTAVCSAILALSLSGAFMGSASAQQRPQNPQGDSQAIPSLRKMNLPQGRSVIVDLPRDAAEIFVGDPKVVEAVVRSARKLYMIGVGKGQTSVHAVDAQGASISEIQITIGRDVSELQEIIRNALPKSSITAKAVENTIILSGSADSAADAKLADDIANGFLTQITSAGGTGLVVNSITMRGRDQVMLKVTIAEIQRNVIKQLGIKEAIARGSWGVWSNDNPSTITTQALTTGNLTLGAYGALSSAGSTAMGLASQIQAYERNGVAKILAEPAVTSVSGEAAKFTVGGEIPVPSSESCLGSVCSIGIVFKPYGVTLNFTPMVLGEGRILLRVATEVTELDPSTNVVFRDVTVPGFRSRKNETSVEIPSGGSMVTAGLIQTTGKQAINGVPGLMNLPILGTLFRSREYQRSETELMIVVTPYLVRPVNPQEVSRPTDNMSDATDAQALMLGRMNRLYATTDNPQIIKNFKGKVGFIAD